MVFWAQRLILRASHAGALSIPFSRMSVLYTVCVVRMFLLLCSLPVITRVPAMPTTPDTWGTPDQIISK